MELEKIVSKKCEECGLVIDEYDCSWCLAFDIDINKNKQCLVINKLRYEYNDIVFADEGTC